MGLLYLAAALRRAGHEVRAIDGLLDDDWQTTLVDQATAWRPDVVGLSALSIDLDGCAAASRWLRAAGYEGRIVAGGPGPTWADAATFAQLGCDAIVHGEGEEALPELVAAWANGGDPRQVRGVSLRDGDVVIPLIPRLIFFRNENTSLI